MFNASGCTVLLLIHEQSLCFPFLVVFCGFLGFLDGFWRSLLGEVFRRFNLDNWRSLKSVSRTFAAILYIEKNQAFERNHIGM